MRVVLASGSPHKLREFKELFSGTPLEIVPPPRTVAVDEDRPTFEGNAAKKARAWATSLGEACLADDSGLCVDSLGGRPGVLSARYAATDPERIARLLGELAGKSDRSAAFHCALCLAWPDGREVCARGVTPGVVAERPAGAGGFGYDPVFLLPEFGRTYAELTPEEKNLASHRGRAARALLEALDTGKRPELPRR